VALTAFALFFDLSCRSSGQMPDLYQELTFSVDSTRLGETVAIGGMVFHAPRSWERIDSSTVSHIRQAVSGDTNQSGVALEGVFVNSTNGAVLVVTSFDRKTTEPEEFAKLAYRFAETFGGSTSKPGPREERLLLSDIPAVQLYATDSLRVQFKFLLDLKIPIGLDYSVPRVAWSQEVRSVESSLGSIRRQ
jgi:hypothetical protein